MKGSGFMLSVAVHKDVAEYQPKIIGKMTTRTLLAICGAIGVSLFAGIYMHFILGLNVSDNMFVIYAVSLPFWCAGFWRPKGLPFEKFVPLYLQHEFSDNRLFYTPSIVKIGYVESNEQNKEKSEVYGKEERKFFAKTKAIEAYSPRAGRVL